MGEKTYNLDCWGERRCPFYSDGNLAKGLPTRVCVAAEGCPRRHLHEYQDSGTGRRMRNPRLVECWQPADGPILQFCPAETVKVREVIVGLPRRVKSWFGNFVVSTTLSGGGDGR